MVQLPPNHDYYLLCQERRYLQEGERPYLKEGEDVKSLYLWHLHVYRSKGTIAECSDVQLRFYFMRKSVLPKTPPLVSSIAEIADAQFIANTSARTQLLYFTAIQEAVSRLHVCCIDAYLRYDSTFIRGYRLC